MEVHIKDNHELEIGLGDVFYDSNQSEYFIFSKLKGDTYGLISSNFDNLYEDEQHNSEKHAINALKLYVKEQYLKYYSQNEFNIYLRVEKK